MEGWLNPEDRLEILHRVDQERSWGSLDDKRLCLVCERVFSGRQVEIERHGSKYTLHCPTTNCPSDHTRWLARGVPMAEAASTPEPGGQRSFSFLFEEDAQPEPSKTR